MLNEAIECDRAVRAERGLEEEGEMLMGEYPEYLER